MNGLDGCDGMKSAFEQGTIAEVWKTIDARKWFDTDFEEFINKEVVKNNEKKSD